MNKLEQEIIEEFDNIYSQGGFYMRKHLLSFIKNLRLQDKQDLLTEIEEWAENKQKGRDNNSADWNYGYDSALFDLQAFIKSLR